MAMALMVAVAAKAMKAVDLRCEYVTDPLCVDTKLPSRLSWVPDDGGRSGAAQSAYRILAATSPELLREGVADVWDSGRVPSGATAHIPMGGKMPGAFARCYWSVRLWDEKGRPGPWSDTASWRMGVLSPVDWQGARWIAMRPDSVWRARWDAQKEYEAAHRSSAWPLLNYANYSLWQVYDSACAAYDPAPIMRKEFVAPEGMRSATLYICGLGYFEASVNGRSVSDDVLNPAWTVYDRNSLYCTYDVTSLLRQGGANALGVTLGRGQFCPISNDAWDLCKSSWVAQPRLLALLRMECADGHVEYVATDRTWRVAGGPVVFDDTRIGEIYDARREQPGWDKPGFDDSAWSGVSAVDWPMDVLRAQMLPPVRRGAVYRPVKRLERPGGITLFDIGQNIAGWARVRVKGPRGARVLVEYCELPSDTALVANLHPARLQISAAVADRHFGAFHDATSEVRQQNAYILRGGGSDEEFECHFSYKGFQYVRVTADPSVEVMGLEGVAVHTALAPAGTFECSDPTVNQLQHMARVTMLNNMVGLPTDCPHREKQGWTADGYFTASAAMYNFDMAQFYAKWMHDLRDTQTASGALCTVAPSSGYCAGVSVTWPAALMLVTSDMYDFYGERRLPDELYGAMGRFAGHCRTHEIEGHPGEMAEVLGDWVSPADSILPELRGSSILAPPEGVTTYAASSYYAILRKMERFAAITGHEADTAMYGDWARRVRSDFNSAYFRPDEAAYYGTQPTGYRLAPNAVALYEGLVPDGRREAVAQRFVAELASGAYKARTGFLGTRAMMKWLPEVDPEAAWRVVTQPEYPGWGYMVGQGANTMWEDWAACASIDHMPYCLVSEYFYRYLAGIRISHAVDGRMEITIAPSFVAGLDWARGSYRSLYGLIESEWHRDGSGIRLRVVIPANCEATLCGVERTYPKGKSFKIILYVVVISFAVGIEHHAIPTFPRSQIREATSWNSCPIIPPSRLTAISKRFTPNAWGHCPVP